MTIAEWMLLAAVLIYLLTIAPFKPLGWRTFDNAKPRDPAFWAEPLRARAQGAHINGIETFPFFAAYLLNSAWTRTLIWNAGFAVNLAIFFMPWWSR